MKPKILIDPRKVIAAIAITPVLAALLFWLFCLPQDLFGSIPTSTVVEAADGDLLGARVASDGQWRFPPSSDVPEKYARCLILFEDRYFHVHHGVNPLSIIRAAWSNLRAGKVVSGGSTITMQVIRLSRTPAPSSSPVPAPAAHPAPATPTAPASQSRHVMPGPDRASLQALSPAPAAQSRPVMPGPDQASLQALSPAPATQPRPVMPGPDRASRPTRNLSDKLLEAIMATRLESRCTKREILSLYASYAPFGGNVVGIEAASWRYFAHPASQLSWAEAATLAVLPNSPSLIHPGRNRNALKIKRDKLLSKVLSQGWIDSLTYSLAIEEPLPDAPEPLPDHAFHLVQNISVTSPGERVRTSIDSRLQTRMEQTLNRWSEDFSRSLINDLAAVVIDVHTGEPIAYIGNSRTYNRRPGSLVDIASSPRSTGSILKPFLYGALLQKGSILPHSLLPDIPVNYGGFTPHNASGFYCGAVPASEALVRSLNVPAVEMLCSYGVENFQNLLQKAGMSTLTRPSTDYGLSLILGGAEGRLDEITRMYAGISAAFQGCQWLGNDWPLTDVCTLYYIMDVLKNLDRPDELDRSLIPDLLPIAWKTGTSYGGRDAWAVGITSDYAVGVWAGNASGASSPDLLGAKTAGPVLFDIFTLLPRTTHTLPAPSHSASAPVMPGPDPTSPSSAPVIPGPDRASHPPVWAEVCPESGMLKSRFCPRSDSLLVPSSALKSPVCPYHRPFSLTSDSKYRLSAPEPGSHVEILFVLPPAMEYYYRRIHPEYSGAPPLKPQSSKLDEKPQMAFIYPQNGVSIKIPPLPDGTRGEIVASLAVSIPDLEVFWHLDSQYLGSTLNIHKLSICPDPGAHILTVVDENGATASVSFVVE